MPRKRQSKARKTEGQCKTCWDNGQLSAVYPLDYLKNTHISWMNKPRTSRSRTIRIHHEPITIKPSQMQPFIHYYPIKNGTVITEAKTHSFFKKKQTVLTTTSKSISITSSANVVPIASFQARNNSGNRKRKREKEEADNTDNVEPPKKRHKAPIKKCLQKALKRAINNDNLLSMQQIDKEISGIDSNRNEMNEQELFNKQQNIINSLSTYITLHRFNALDIDELLLREHIEGLSIKILEREYLFCRYCATYIGGDLCGCYNTGKPLKNGCNSHNVHQRDPDQFVNIKQSWRHHKQCQRHKDNKNMAEGRGDKVYYEKEIEVLMTLCRVILEMKISRIANWKYPLILSRKYRDKVNIGNRPHSKGCVAPIVNIMATKCKEEIANDMNTVLPSTLHKPSIHLTADKGQGLGQKVEFGRIVYYSQETGDFVSKPLICNVLSYKNGEKSGGAKELAAGYRETFDLMKVTDIAHRWKSTVFDNEYHEKNVTREIEIQYKLENKQMFIQFRDHNHNMNLVWVKLYDDNSFAMIIITNQRSIITPLNHGAVVMLKATDIMGVAAVKCPGHSPTKWMQHQLRSIGNYLWMKPAIYRIYKELFDEKQANKSDADAMTKEAKQIYGKLMNMECGQNDVGKRLLNDIGAPYKLVSLQNETFHHEPWELQKEANYLIDDIRFRMNEVDEQIANYQKCIIPKDLSYKYPSTSLLYIDENIIRVKMDMRRLNKLCPKIKSWSKPANIKQNEWDKKISDRNKLRKKIIKLNENFIIKPTKCILPMANYCKSCGLSSYLCPLISCVNCCELSHLRCNGITDKSVKYYTGNELEFYCVLNECNKLLTPYKSKKNQQCDAELNHYIKEIKNKLKREQIIEELKCHNIYNERVKRNVPDLRKKLIEHYKNVHLPKYKKKMHKKKENEKQKKKKVIQYIEMSIDDFCKWIHNEHKKMLTTILEALYHYVDRVPALCKIAGKCFDFKSFRKEIMDEFGRIFSRYLETKAFIRKLKAIESGKVKCDMNPNKASNLLLQQKRVLSDLKQCKAVKIKIQSIISGGVTAFLQLVDIYNNDHDDTKDLNQCKHEYILLSHRIFYMLCSKQLVFRWHNNKICKQRIYKLSYDLTDLIMSDPLIYTGCHNVAHIYEIIVGGDACEPNLESDISLFILRCHGRNSLQIKKYHDENILVTECKDETSPKTEKILRGTAVTYRADHSSPFVQESKCKVSPSVDKELFPKKPEEFVVFLPKSLGGTFDSISKLVKKSPSYKPLTNKSLTNKTQESSKNIAINTDENDKEDEIDKDDDIVSDLLFDGNVSNIQTKGGSPNIAYHEQIDFDDNMSGLLISDQTRTFVQEGNDNKEDL